MTSRIAKSNQKVHKERSQPFHRCHLGQLEKKSDYKERADDYQKKRDALQTLRKKAIDKNPDEFYFHMINSGTKNGVHFEKEKSPDQDSVIQQKLMESKDLKYVIFKRDVERKKIEKLKSTLHLTDSQGIQQNKHTIFVDSKKEANKFNPVKYLDTDVSLISRTFNRPRIETLKQSTVVGAQSKRDVKMADKSREKAYDELVKRMEREKELTIVINKLQLRRNLTNSKGQKSKQVVKGSSSRASVYKWDFERKR